MANAIDTRDRPTLAEWLREKPFTLSMSSGFFGFYAHLGMLSALDQAGLRPIRMTGSSAGALVAAAMGSRFESTHWTPVFLALSRDDFWDPGLGLGLLRGQRFEDRLRGLLGIASFAGLEIPVAVSAFDIFANQTAVFETANEDLVRAVRASCAVPFLFHPVPLARRFYLDGGIRDRHGMAGTRAGERVLYHHIASRSPWRRPNSPALSLPTSNAENPITTLVIEGLPRSGPNRMHLAATILGAAQAATAQALNQPVQYEGGSAVVRRQAVFCA